MEGKTKKEKSFVRVDEVAELLDISESHAYKIMRELKAEAKEKEETSEAEEEEE